MNTKRTFQVLLASGLLLGASSCSSSSDDKASCPYISKVYEFKPAVGQFTNDLPKYKKGDTYADMLEKANKALVGPKPSMISLGGFGGFVVFGFDHTIENKPGFRDFRVLGNAFQAASNPNPEAGKDGGSAEPGVIMVSYDANKNGLPDDAWYEIKGSEYDKSTKNYSITYFKPDPNKAPKPNQESGYAADTEYIRWEDSLGNKGWKTKNTYHSQSYYPEWIDEDQITFTGTLLPENSKDESGNGTYWVSYPYEYGYADNYLNSDPRSAIDIDWAIDKDGNPANLPGIDFVKVYTGVNQEIGWLGEISTEVAGAYDLHLRNETIQTK